MSATVFSDSRYGIVDDSTASGMNLANLRYSYSTEEAVASNHIGCDDGLAIFNDSTDVTADGVVATKTAGIGLQLADVITLANASDDSLDLNDDSLFTASDANAGVILASLEVSRGNKAFETGSLSGKYRPLIATNSPTVITD